MARYLMRLSGKEIEYASVPKGARVEKRKDGMKRVVKGSKVGLWFPKGYNVIEAKSANKATEKLLGTEIKINKK